MRVKPWQCFLVPSLSVLAWSRDNDYEFPVGIDLEIGFLGYRCTVLDKDLIALAGYA